MAKVGVQPAVLFALGGALIASLVANAALVRSGNRYLAQSNAVRLDPGDLRVYAAEPPPATELPRLVFFGDSRALMWGTPELRGVEAVNRGIGNETTTQILLRVQADVAKLHPAVIVFQGGVNDLKAIAEFPERRAEIVATCKTNLERITGLLRATGARVVLVSIFDIGDIPPWRAPFWSNEVAPAVREVNAYLRTLVGPGVAFLDAAPVLDDARGRVRREFQYDYLHVNAAGYAALTASLVPLLAAPAR